MTQQRIIAADETWGAVEINRELRIISTFPYIQSKKERQLMIDSFLERLEIEKGIRRKEKAFAGHQTRMVARDEIERFYLRPYSPRGKVANKHSLTQWLAACPRESYLEVTYWWSETIPT